ncbi:MAG TPA: bifunctional diaminohydroxyphosphoribosylaminopyrimidine deaminase/5-amino-6-(5-phosphoribosylamino)uracil reductase RibD [Bacteroidales bacterium]|nr:MAG: riboflavin biosynthesis protein RibD [Bacteroidetes bacterium GWF2_33_38]OFY91492.1 MAG: riboflavin biosynthesis protein RibD [Bacteroidetes bacterium RIFOXYA2_FULL_33_7]HBF88012.1 bifunctional diaminohydroxyphosphoribosylaminopyrimidine deaminase/5-amino-6-(5-phosphoribosylamino)uracil reductase RibD [Bacteroidales bacterium]
MNDYEKYIKRCLELAQFGAGNTSPNPMVGSVIVHHDKIIGEGWHQKAGEPHAEVNAINSVKDKSLLKESTLYVSLEPCSHYGKTPPCADLIVSYNIPKVVICNIDPHEKVAGKGIHRMKNAGIEIVSGILENEGEELNKRFFTFHRKKRPYIILKWAQTIDGLIDSDNKSGKGEWISNQYSKVLVHKWRSEEDAIMIGTNTAMKDNPMLNVREWNGKNPIRIVLDKTLRLPKNLNVFDSSIETIVFTEKENPDSKNLRYIKIKFDNNLLNNILHNLVELNIQSIFVEGGGMLFSLFLKNNIWDEARIIIGDKKFRGGVKAPMIDPKYLVDEKMIINDKILFLKNDYLD